MELLQTTDTSWQLSSYTPIKFQSFCHDVTEKICPSFKEIGELNEPRMKDMTNKYQGTSTN